MRRAPAVELVGYLGAAVGVGEAARLYADSLRSAGIAVALRDVPLEGRDAAGVTLPVGDPPAPTEIDFNLLCLNPEQMVPYRSGADAPPETGRTTIAIWSWEVDMVPQGWREAARGLGEVWTYSRFSAERIGRALDVPVIDMAPPVVRAKPGPAPSVALPEGFRVLVMFDYLSTLERKNPLGAIEAFRLAFQPADGAVLVVKSVNGRHRPDRQEELLAAIADRKDIVLIDETISSEQRDGLIAACDCMLSLHRSEGHGLTLAEAMAVGKPVVATGYGGNTEFMDEDNSYLVPWLPARVGEGVEHYPAGASWAEPDLESAARWLRAIQGDAEEAARRGARAQASVCSTLSVEAVGMRMRTRLEMTIGRAEGRKASSRGLLGRWRDVAHRCLSLPGREG
jgi:glycosyltransferase involved in cell wall biosynthesis